MPWWLRAERLGLSHTWFGSLKMDAVSGFSNSQPLSSGLVGQSQLGSGSLLKPLCKCSGYEAGGDEFLFWVSR